MKSRIYIVQKTKGFACITTIRQCDHAVQETLEIFLSLFKRLKMKVRHYTETGTDTALVRWLGAHQCKIS